MDDRIHRAGVLTLFLTSLALRLVAIGHPVEVDSAHLIQEGSDFVRALLVRDWLATFGGAHPGLPSMWLIGGSLTAGYALGWRSGPATNSLVEWLAALAANRLPALDDYLLPRLVQAPITAGLLCLFLGIASRAFGRKIAWIATALFAFDPFVLAYNRVIVPDALAVDALAIALAAAWTWLRGRGDVRWMIGAGVALGFATASKLTCGLLGPVIVVWSLLARRYAWRTRLAASILCGLSALVTFGLLFPALWAGPLPVWQAFVQELRMDELGPRATFFLGQPTDTPDARFYPAVLAYRASPLLLLGSLLAVIAALWPRRRPTMLECWTVAGLVTFVIMFLAVISLETGKIDRWALPVWPALAIMAGIGWARGIEGLGTRGRVIERWGLAVLAAVQLVTTLLYAPDFFSYGNPLLGGATRASRVLMTGVGEGLDDAGAWLAALPGASELTVASFYPTSFAPFFPGRTVKWTHKLPNGELSWVRSHYVVFYVNQWQRERDPEQMAYIERLPPIHTISRHGVEYVRIYRGPVARLEDVPRLSGGPITFVLPATGDAIVRLHGYEYLAPDTGVLYWEAVRPIEANAVIHLVLRTATGQEVGKSAQPPLAGYLNAPFWRPGDIMRDVQRLNLSAALPDGPLTLEVGWMDADDGEMLVAYDQAGRLPGTTVSLEAATGALSR